MIQNILAQVIIAGQTTGPYINYGDSEDVFVSKGSYDPDFHEDDTMTCNSSLPKVVSRGVFRRGVRRWDFQYGCFDVLGNEIDAGDPYD